MRKVKYLLLILFLSIIMIPSVYASTKTYDRNDLPNFGVNKKWNINDSNRSNVLNTKAVDASELVYDFADILTNKEEDEMYELCKKFKQDTGYDLVFVSDDFSYTNDSVNTVYAQDFYDYNDFGLDNADKLYSGIVIFRNAYEYDRFTKFWVVGEAQFYAKTHLDELTNSLRSGFVAEDYVRGVSDFIDQYEEYIENKDDCFDKYTMDDMGNLIENYSPSYLFIIGIPGIITFIVVTIYIKKNKMIKKSIEAQDYIDKSTLKFSRREEKLVSSHTTSYVMSSSSSGGGGGGHSSSGGGGCGGGGHF